MIDSTTPFTNKPYPALENPTASTESSSVSFFCGLLQLNVLSTCKHVDIKQFGELM